ncbi:MAG: addiction module protein [Propionibacteriaceae bacterium]|jgi:putative addiction module component (TIGR02574 family)|nr:addiction module protein [Propionibacteriaceae bacterium]
MVSLALQESLEALTPAERVAVIDFLQRSLVARDTGLTEAEKALVRQRDAELEADPSLGLTWAELDARLQSIWG